MVSDAQSDAGPDRRKRVVLVTQPYWPDIQSTSHLLTELLEAMTDAPIGFTVVCGHPVMLPTGMSSPIPSQEERKGIRIFRCGLRCDYKRNLLLRALYMASFVLSASWRIVREGRGALVCTVTNPPFAPAWIRLLSRFGGFRYQIVCHDVFPDGLVSLGKLRASGAIAGLWRWANRRALCGADGIVVLGRDMRELLRDRYGVGEERLHLVPNWSIADGGGRFEPGKTETWREQGFPEDAFVVQYSGNMGLWHDIDTLVRAAAALKEHPRLRFLFIGGGMRQKRARALADELGADNIVWLPFQSEERLADSLACCHLALVSQREGLEGVAVPCKLYGILASGRGILAMVPDGSEVARVVAEEDCGVRLAPDDDDGLASAIRRLADDPAAVQGMGARAYAAFDGKYRLAHAAARYREFWLGEAEGEG